MDVLILILSLALILLSAELFTNAIEWLGKKLKLSEGAVGSVLAAVGTALPETMIPLIALVFTRGGDEAVAEEIGIGAILGAPFMLGTLALFVTGVAAIAFKHNGAYRPEMFINRGVMTRDQEFFLLAYTAAILAAFVRQYPIKVAIAAGLLAVYGTYLSLTLRGSGTTAPVHLSPLYFARRLRNPGTGAVLLQVLVALGGILVGARLFVGGVERLAHTFGVPAFVLSIIIAPIATELPEKFNSIIWVSQGKDTLALGNITGAMVFQSSVIPALGIILTPWRLGGLALLSAALAVLSVLVVYVGLKWRGVIRPPALLYGGFFYSVFVAAVLFSQRENPVVLAFPVLVLAILIYVNRLYADRAARFRLRET